MNKDKQMIQYKEKFFSKLKQKIKSLFFKSNIKNIEKENIAASKHNEELNKEEIMRLYKNVKDEKVDLNNIEAKDLYRVMLLLKEEIEIIENKINREMQDVDIHYNNLKMYNKQVSLLKKDS